MCRVWRPPDASFAKRYDLRVACPKPDRQPQGFSLQVRAVPGLPVRHNLKVSPASARPRAGAISFGIGDKGLDGWLRRTMECE